MSVTNLSAQENTINQLKEKGFVLHDDVYFAPPTYQRVYKMESPDGEAVFILKNGESISQQEWESIQR